MPLDVADLIFVWLANIEYKDIFLGVETSLQFLGLYLWNLRGG